jgi:hypothetical protein
LDSLTLDDVKAPPQSWPVFARGAAANVWSAAYDVPADLDDLQDRLQANVVHYLVRAAPDDGVRQCQQQSIHFVGHRAVTAPSWSAADDVCYVSHCVRAL